MSAVQDDRLRRTLLVAILAILALPVIAYSALWIWFESTAGEPPDLFADVPQDFTDDGPWIARMNEAFPTGTPESVLLQRLRAEGFEVHQGARTAQYRWSHGFCGHDINAEWSAEGGRVTRTSASYMNACP